MRIKAHQVDCPGEPHNPITAADFDADLAARGISTGTAYTWYDGQIMNNSGWQLFVAGPDSRSESDA